MNFEIKEKNGVYIGKPSGWIDTNAAPEFLEAIRQLEAQAGKSIQLDCTDLEYICSLGLRGLLKLKKESVAKGGTLELTNVQPEVMNILRMTGFDKLLTIL
ncbi:MAG: STAS domain-containing protein [Bacteroidaceae bacterium]|nr:STAS domain-containing protein [Bacteroidaceae bacterium]